jgi:transcriptional regulator with PAS, ATPase and Fis domain
LGGTREHKANVRVITATNKDLEELVEKGKFRQDLFYRINVVRLDLPPLRERREDIAALVQHFIERFNRLQGRMVTGISQEALSLLMFHDYPGNIRELENIIEHALVLCPEGEIGIHCLPENLQNLTAQPVSRRHQRSPEINGIPGHTRSAQTESI